MYLYERSLFKSKEDVMGFSLSVYTTGIMFNSQLNSDMHAPLRAMVQNQR